ncbi:E3 ubiquitin-protein ligase rnf213-alpha-like [Amphiura filiformis]|uniref:E3 ubiquitin-protein ligase rnf213-alpha-like n=1 Tax=Amphiura filiformis TaxID=82378 RepID=UPI003B21F5A5
MTGHVHGGTTSNDIFRKIEKAQKIAIKNKRDHGVDTVLFFDEANTTEAIGLIKEIMCDGRVKGRPIDMADGALKVIAACNPYRRHTEAMIDRLKAAGLGYHVTAEDTQEKFGTIPLRELVYRVQALPPSMLPLVWDFGQLNAEIEAKYIRQIVQRYVNTERLDASNDQANIITDVLSASQQFMRDQENECSFVSLRDVERCLEVLVWFYDHMDMLRPLLKAKAEEIRKRDEDDFQSEDEEEAIIFEDVNEGGLDDLTMSLVLAIGVCYHACLQEGRQDYRENVAEAFDDPCELPDGADQVLEEITRCQDVFLDQVMNLDANIARNAALRENVFMMVICIELRIPLFLVGKPGSSKSLAKTIVADAMQGEAARSSDLFKHLKQVHMSSYQCSPLSTPDGIVAIFRQCSKFQEGKDLDKFVSVVVLDEVGLAEDSPRMPLKTLHPLLETGSEEDEDEPVLHKKVAFIGLSNWALDPAKMNRGVLVSREEPNLKELEETARGICSTDSGILELADKLIPSLAKAYLEIYTNQERQYFGLRDYYSLIKMVYHIIKKSRFSPSWAQIEHTVRRNFGGLPNAEDQVEVFRKQDTLSLLANMEPKEVELDCSPAGLLEASLDRDATGHGETRYLLILTENYAALPIIQQQLLHQQDAITIFGSSFPYDQEYTQVCRNINRIKVCMETGRTVVLLNLENLYESLYDALNQYYVYFGGQRYVDLGLGTHKVKCRVHTNFRLIVIADKDVVYERFPTPLINRLEKHFLATSTMLTDAQQHLLKEIEQWVHRFSSINILHQHQNRHKFEVSDAFVGYHGDTLASLVFQVCKKMNQTDGDQEWKDLVKKEVKALLLQCATPDSVMRLSQSKLLTLEVEEISDVYFSQDHSSLESYLQQCHLHVDQDSATKDIMAFVTTHSRLLGKRDWNQLANALHIPVNIIFLQNFHTEQQFCSEVREFLTSCKMNPGLLLIQCDDGHLNNQLIACASYCVQDEKTQAKELDADMKPAHVVFVIQLAMESRGFTGFRGTGIWSSFHIDDLQPAQPNRPEIARLRGLSIKNLFERDPSLHAAPQDTVEETGPVEDEVGDTDDETEPGTEMKASKINSQEGEEQPANQTTQQYMPHRQRSFVDKNHENKLVVSEMASAQEGTSAAGEIGPLVIDIDRLLQDSILSAASRISDSESRAKRTTERIALLNQLFMESENTEGVLDFLHVIKHRLFQLISEREERRGGLVDAWLSTEALRVADVQKSGTFRKAIWQRLIAIVSPLLAELVAFSDCSDNLSLLLEHGTGHWQHQLWLAILLDSEVTTLRYDNFLSPKQNILRERALVRVAGSSDKPMTAKLPFSWLLKEFLETMHEHALDLKSMNQASNLETIFQNLVIESPWCQLLSQHVLAEVQEDFIQKYLADFIRMKYKTNLEKENVENELECVYQALEKTTQLTGRRLEALEGCNKLVQLLVSVHLSYVQIQGRLSHFARLIELYPALLDESNVAKLIKQEGQMTLDGTAIQMTVESLRPESRYWKDRGYQQRWFAKVEAAKPIIESIIQTGIHDSCYREVHKASKLWEKICVLRLFVEHICPVNVEVEVVISNQGLMLWKSLANNQNGMKTLEGLRVVENVLNMCCKHASKAYFKMGVEDCPLCYKADITQPIELPCGKICCKDCLTKWFRTTSSRSCPACKEDVAEDYQLEVKTENREAIQKYNSFRQRCNAFFMGVVSQLCFAEGTPPNCEVVERLMTYVTRETEMKDSNDKQQRRRMQTKRLTATKGDGIDPSPVIRSVLLQLLLQSNVTEVQKYISQYLEQAHHVLAQHKTQDIIEVCQLFIQCLEDSFHRQAAKHSNPTHGLIVMATENLQEARQWLENKEPDEHVTIHYLIAIASVRFGLVAAAKLMYDIYYQKDGELSVNMRQVNGLLYAAQEICGLEYNKEVQLFLVRHLCHCYGTNTLETLSQQRILQWVIPQELIPQNEECPDRFVVCGDAYCSIREAMAQAAITRQYKALDKTLEGCNQQLAEQREYIFMLSLYREVTMMYGSQQDLLITQQVRDDIKSYIETHTVVRQKVFAVSLIDNIYMSGACDQLVASPGQSIFHQSLVAMVMHAIITFNCSQGNSDVSPLVNLLQKPNLMKNSYLPTMPEDHRMEVKRAIDEAGRRGETYAWYECPNGHLYTIGDCGRPVFYGQCKECGANIGGEEYTLIEGNRKVKMADTTAHGHILGDATGRQARPIAERHLSAVALSIIRVIMHSVMIGASVTNPQDAQDLIDSQPEAVGQFLWQHIEADMQLMAASCGKSLDDCLFIVHLVLQCIATKQQDNQSKI